MQSNLILDILDFQNRCSKFPLEVQCSVSVTQKVTTRNLPKIKKNLLEITEK